jgi:hypothetical protein
VALRTRLHCRGNARTRGLLRPHRTHRMITAGIAPVQTPPPAASGPSGELTWFLSAAPGIRVLTGQEVVAEVREVPVSSASGDYPGRQPGRPNGPAAGQNTPRAPRRLVLLKDSEESEVEAVLAEYEGAAVSGLHADLQQFATRHRGRQLAAEWLGPLGWTRFLWCRK